MAQYGKWTYTACACGKPGAWLWDFKIGKDTECRFCHRLMHPQKHVHHQSKSYRGSGERATYAHAALARALVAEKEKAASMGDQAVVEVLERVLPDQPLPKPKSPYGGEFFETCSSSLLRPAVKSIHVRINFAVLIHHDTKTTYLHRSPM